MTNNTLMRSCYFFSKNYNKKKKQMVKQFVQQNMAINGYVSKI